MAAQDSNKEQLVQLEKLAKYVPRLVLDQLLFRYNNSDAVSDLDEIWRTREERAISLQHGCIVVADVSGFTQLNESFSSHGTGLGSHAGEKVTLHLNEYFTQLLDIVEKHGGDCVKFAGDALIIVFHSEGLFSSSNNKKVDRPADIAIRAVRCAQQLQNEVGTYKAHGVELSLHIAVAFGELTALHLGGLGGDWEFFLAGEPFRGLDKVVDVSRSGEVVVSKKTWELVSSSAYCQGTKLNTTTEEVKVNEIRSELAVRGRTPLHLHAIPPLKIALVAKALRAYVPKPVLLKIDAGQDDWLGENRQVTAIFVQLRGLQLDTVVSRDAIDKADDVCIAAMRIIKNNNGFRRQFLVDDKGTTLIVVFGVPPFTTVDDPTRAVKTAMELRKSLTQQSVDHAMGIASGSVYVGSVGSARRQEHAVVGDTMNSAARLAHKAVSKGFGIILCDKATASIASTTIKMKSEGQITVKGREQFIEIFSPVAHRQQQSMFGSHGDEVEAPSFDREREMQLFAKALVEFAQKGESRSVLVQGPEGIGKTTVLRQCFRLLQAQKKIKTILCSGSSADEEVVLGMWTNAIIQIMGISPLQLAESSRISRKKNRNVVSTFLQRYSPDQEKDEALVDYLMRVAGGAQGFTVEELGGEDETVMLAKTETALFTLFTHFITRLKQEGQFFCIVIEDLHYLDRASADLVARLLELPLLLVASTRVNTSTTAHIELLNLLTISGATTSVVLTGLSEANSIKLACQKLGASKLSPACAKFVTERCGGNPLYITELVLHLSTPTIGAITVNSDGECTLTDDPQLIESLPLSLKALMTNRLDSLTIQDAFLCKIASTFGTFGFTPALLREVMIVETKGNNPVSVEDVAARVIELERKFLFRGDEIPGAFVFCHEMVRRTCYDTLLFSQQCRIHQQIAGILEQAAEKGNERRDPVLSFHYTMALRSHGPDVHDATPPAPQSASASATAEKDKDGNDIPAPSTNLIMDNENDFFIRARRYVHGPKGIELDSSRSQQVRQLFWDTTAKQKQFLDRMRAHISFIQHPEYERTLVRSGRAVSMVIERQLGNDIKLMQTAMYCAADICNGLKRAANLLAEQDRVDALLRTMDSHAMEIYLHAFALATHRHEEILRESLIATDVELLFDRVLPHLCTKLNKAKYENEITPKQLDVVQEDKFNTFISLINSVLQLRQMIEKVAELMLPEYFKGAKFETLLDYDKFIEAASQPNPNDLYTRKALVTYERYRSMSKDSEAKFAASREVSKDKEEAAKNYAFGRQMLDMNELSNAKKFLLKAIALDRNKHTYHQTLGQILHMLGEYKEASEAFFKGKSLQEARATDHPSEKELQDQAKERKKDRELKAQIKEQLDQVVKKYKQDLADQQALFEKRKDEFEEEYSKLEEEVDKLQRQYQEKLEYSQKLEQAVTESVSLMRESEEQLARLKKDLAEDQTNKAKAEALAAKAREMQAHAEHLERQKRQVDVEKRQLERKHQEIARMQDKQQHVSHKLTKMGKKLRQLEQVEHSSEVLIPLQPEPTVTAGVVVTNNNEHPEDEEPDLHAMCDTRLAEAQAFKKTAETKVSVLAAERDALAEEVKYLREELAKLRGGGLTNIPSPSRPPPLFLKPNTPRTSATSAPPTPSPITHHTAPPQQGSGGGNHSAHSSHTSQQSHNSIVGHGGGLQPMSARGSGGAGSLGNPPARPAPRAPSRDSSVMGGLSSNPSSAVAAPLRRPPSTPVAGGYAVGGQVLNQEPDRARVLKYFTTSCSLFSETTLRVGPKLLDQLLLAGGGVDHTVQLCEWLDIQGRKFTDMGELVMAMTDTALAYAHALDSTRDIVTQLVNAHIPSPQEVASAICMDPNMGPAPLDCMNTFLQAKRKFTSVDALKAEIKTLNDHAVKQRSEDSKHALAFLSKSKIFQDVGLFTFKAHEISSLFAAGTGASINEQYRYHKSKSLLGALLVTLRSMEAHYVRVKSVHDLLPLCEHFFIQNKRDAKALLDYFKSPECKLFPPSVANHMELSDLQCFVENGRAGAVAINYTYKRWDHAKKYERQFTSTVDCLKQVHAEEEEIIAYLTVCNFFDTAKPTLHELGQMFLVKGGGTMEALSVMRTQQNGSKFPTFHDFFNAFLEAANVNHVK